MGDPGGGIAQEHMNDRIEAVKGCAILFSKGLSDLHAVNVKNLDVFPVKMENNREITEVIEYVQRMIVRPPLWMQRAMGYVPVENRKPENNTLMTMKILASEQATLPDGMCSNAR